MTQVSNAGVSEFFTALYSVNQTNGSIGAIGPAFNDGVGDLTSDTRAASFRVCGVRIDSNELLRIDPATGAQIGALAITNTRANITSIAFDVVTGRLFGNTTVFYGDTADTLYEIDPLTGNATLIGQIGFANTYALGFDQLGNLFGIAEGDDLLSIDTVLGTGTKIADIGLSGLFDIASRPEDDVMFMASSGSSSLYTLDTTNGATALVGPYGSPTNIVGLAFAAPLPGILWLIAIGALGFGFLRLRLQAR